MKKSFLTSLLKVLLLLVMLGMTAVSAQAHSTKGRLKVALDKDVVGVDDVAYFVESYVNRHLYKNRFKKSKSRFYVKEFQGVDQRDKEADIRFLVLDMKDQSDFPDKMTILRGDDNIWRYQPEGEPALEMYTYVPKWRYYYERYMLPISGAGLAVAVGIFFVLRLKKRRKGAPTCEA